MEKKMLNEIVLKSDYTRRYPDPINQSADQGPYNIEHFILLSKAVDLPTGISKEPNPREQKIDYGIYKEVRKSLEDDTDSTFHLKNKGITIIAHKVDISEDKKTATLFFGPKDGIADGAHTYEIIMAAQKERTCPASQYVKLEIITGVPESMAIDITGGLNTAVQVQEASLENLKGRFEWFKDTVKNMPYADKIAYMQNEKKDYDIRDIVSIMTLFNIKHFNSNKHPKEAYSGKAKCLELYKADQASYEMLKPIVKDILYLSDYVQIKGKERYNRETGGKAGRMKGLYENRERGAYKFIFMNAESESQLYDGALYPILGALRFLVERKKQDTAYSWRLSSFDEVKKFFDEVAAKMIETTYNTSKVYANKPTAIGKDDNLWDNLYKTVALHYLETRQV